MPIESALSLPLIDHHCHGVVPEDISAERFERLMSEAFAPAPLGTTHWDKPTALAIRRWCAPLLDLPKFSPPEDYLTRRAALGAAEVNRRMLRAAGLEMLLVDSGNRPAELCSVAALGEPSTAPLSRTSTAGHEVESREQEGRAQGTPQSRASRGDICGTPGSRSTRSNGRPAPGSRRSFEDREPPGSRPSGSQASPGGATDRLRERLLRPPPPRPRGAPRGRPVGG